ncbi:hypothetical protein ALP74_00955 [Pseudomonas coronafaciens pv. garcae]|uniref:AAA+ ATPase domain-containing protein n=2 Tax=Pseudomonas syringae group TaxID=136849 RepID=A0AB37QV26_9PSED|nr:hypothetical protein ALP74_00955 [Pseudomonas coronafaciens pv. garcae]
MIIWGCTSVNLVLGHGLSHERKRHMITITARESFAGLSLSNPLVIKEGITVVTGRNGSGKTRLLEIIASHSNILNDNDEYVTAQKFDHSSFSPDFGGSDSAAAYMARQQKAVEAFVENRNAFERPISELSRRHHMQGFDHNNLYSICGKIRRELNKSHSEITTEDVRAYYDEPNERLFGSQDLARLFNAHLKSEFDLRYAFITGFLESDAEVMTRQDVLSIRKSKAAPWDVLNKVLVTVFGDKFYFAAPNESVRNFNQPVRLLDRITGFEVPISQLSSGEKTLMWLTLTLFNSQFFEAGVLAPSVLLLDEPDAFLHPQMVEKMYEILSRLVKEYNVHIVLTTHSPTTVALAKCKIFKIDAGGLVDQDKDSAISELLDGVTQLSVDPENRRQVFVENRTDAIVYQWLFNSMVNHTAVIDPKISLSFIPAGPKTPDDHLKICLRRVFTSAQEHEVEDFVSLVNGMGDCGQVNVYVHALKSGKNRTVRGIVDWDARDSKRSDGVVIAAEGYAYSLENVLLDPLCVLQMVRQKAHEKYSLFEICGEDSAGEDWRFNSRLAQESVDRYIYKVLGRANARDQEIRYLDGRTIATDAEYLSRQGKEIEAAVLSSYPELSAHSVRKNVLEGVGQFMSAQSYKHIPSVFAETFAAVQR